jgi:hypothetical protein
MLSFSIFYWDLIKFHYCADTTERGDMGWKQAQRQGDFMDNSNVHDFRSGRCKKVLDGSTCDYITDDKCISSAMHSNRPHVSLIFAFHSEFRHRTQEHKSQISYKLLHVSKLYSPPTSHIFIASLFQVFHSLVSFSTQNMHKSHIPTSFWYVLKLHWSISGLLGASLLLLTILSHPPNHAPYKLCLCMSSGSPGNFAVPFLKPKTKPLVMTPRVKHALSVWGNLSHEINYTTHNCWWFLKGLKHSLWEIGYICRVQL